MTKGRRWFGPHSAVISCKLGFRCSCFERLRCPGAGGGDKTLSTSSTKKRSASSSTESSFAEPATEPAGLFAAGGRLRAR